MKNRTKYSMTTQKAVRDAFWKNHPQFQPLKRAKLKQNDYKADVRMAFVDFVDNLWRNKEIGDILAFDATL